MFGCMIHKPQATYDLSRNQQHLMCYTLRRGEVSLERLGVDAVVCRQVGHLAPGLAVGPQATNVFLNVSVHYRSNLNDIDLEEPIPQPLSQAQNRRARCRRPRIRPAFATTADPDEDYFQEDLEEENENEEGEFGDGAYGITNEGETIFDEATGCYYYFQDDGETLEGSTCLQGSEENTNHSGDMSRTFEGEESGGVENGRNKAPLHLAFASLDLGAGTPVGGGCARMAHLVTELRTKTDLDLFHVPGAVTNTSTSSLFDPNALGDELERHEKTLQEFDDFLADFRAAQPNFTGVVKH
ncbi:hypothetical protein ACTXT7_001529 [Hymenolepis weldensis]